ncbi:MAG: T9SS type A sorting domain-containing protein [Bacteroidota bacterium]
MGTQQFFYVYNDLATASRQPNGLPLGVEVRVLGWWDDTVPLYSNVFFFRFQIINKSIFTYDSVYIGVWSDPDLGDGYHDDLVGCDTTLSMWYAYNNLEQERTVYGTSPPSAGFQFLDVRRSGAQAEESGFRFVPIQRSLRDPRFHDVYANGEGFHLHMYNYLRGLGYDGQTIVDPTTGQTSTHAVTGDPATGLGWLPRHSNLVPEDFRMMGSSGPSRLAPSDTVTVTIALSMVQGQDRLGSVAQLRFDAERMLDAFRHSAAPSILARPSWSMEYLSGSLPKAQIRVSTTGVQSCSAEFFDGTGQGLFTSSMTGAPEFSTAVELPPALVPGFADIVLRTVQGQELRYRGACNRLSTAARPEQRRLRIAHDQVNGDSLANPGEQIEFMLTVFNRTPWSFDSLTFEPSFVAPTKILNGGFFRDVLTGEESSISQRIAATVDATAGESGVSLVPYVLKDHTWFNRWNDTLRIPVYPFRYAPQEVFPVHVRGNATRTPKIRLVDPSAWRDHQYGILFPSTLSASVVDLNAGDTLIQNQPIEPFPWNLPPLNDISRMVIDGFKILPGNIGRTYFEIREFKGPGGAQIESEPHEQSQRLGRDLTEGRSSSLNTYSVAVGGYLRPNITYELRVSPRGSRYFTGLQYGDTVHLAADRIPFELWNLKGTPDDASDDERMIIVVRDTDRDSHLSPNEILTTVLFSSYSETPPDSFRSDPEGYGDLTVMFKPTARGRFGWPESGTVLRIYPSIAPTPQDLYVIRPTVATLPPHDALEVFANFPNPFNPTTTIKFFLPQETVVKVVVYNLLGAEVAVLVDEERDAGINYAFWGGKNSWGRNVASGVYFYRVSTPSSAGVGKMLLLR